MTRGEVFQVLATGLIIPIWAFVADYLKGRRDKIYRFDEFRLQIYSDFSRDVANALLEQNPADVSVYRRRAWINYEAVQLVSSERLIIQCLRVRSLMCLHLKRIGESPSPQELEASLNEVYDALNLFENIARQEMRVPTIDLDRIKRVVDSEPQAFSGHPVLN